MSFLSVGCTFHFCQNFDICSSSCMLLHQLYDWMCNPDLVEQIVNRRIFLQLTGSSIDVWCQKYQNIVSQEMSLFVACGKFGCSLPQNYAILHLMICSKDFLWNTSACWKTTDKNNANISQFSHKILFLCKWEIHWFWNGIKG